MTKKFSLPRGTADILPDEIAAWQDLEETTRDILKIYRYQEIRTPVFEETGLFVRSLGGASDVVQKQMLNLSSMKEVSETSLKNEGLSLRPEATASIVRSYIQNSFDKKESLSKLYYIGPMFRGERPQKGRLRQFHQIGVEAIGPNSSIPSLDAEIIALSVHLLTSFGLKDLKLKINSLGTKEDKEKFFGLLREQLRKNISSLCEDCQQRFERNVFRILDCKNEGCKRIVAGLSLGQTHLSKFSQDYFSEVKKALELWNVPYKVSPTLVRGLDYYTHTVFEISHEALGSQDALGAGGRYNGLVGELGGNNVGAIGFALGMERILLVKSKEAVKSSLEVFIVYHKESMELNYTKSSAESPQEYTNQHAKEFGALMESKAYKEAFVLLNNIRKVGISADMSYFPASMKSQMRLANKLGARQVVIIGEDELKEKVVMLKDMEKGTQEKVGWNSVIKELKNNK